MIPSSFASSEYLFSRPWVLLLEVPGIDDEAVAGVVYIGVAGVGVAGRIELEAMSEEEGQEVGVAMQVPAEVGVMGSIAVLLQAIVLAEAGAMWAVWLPRIHMQRSCTLGTVDADDPVAGAADEFLEDEAGYLVPFDPQSVFVGHWTQFPALR